MNLISVLGETFAISPAQWIKALSTAPRYGWKPSGTRGPAINFTESRLQEWSGTYAPFCGQEVMRADARGLGESLQRGADAGDLAAGEMLALSGYCARGGFVIVEGCESDNAALINLWMAVHRPERETAAPSTTPSSMSVRF